MYYVAETQRRKPSDYPSRTVSRSRKSRSRKPRGFTWHRQTVTIRVRYTSFDVSFVGEYCDRVQPSRGGIIRPLFPI